MVSAELIPLASNKKFKNNMINKYELNARVYPTVIMFLPILFLALYFSIDYQNVQGVIGGLGLTTILVFVFGQLGRDRGKKVENKLWKDWGGTPSVQVLRYSNDIIDQHTKSRIHSNLYNITGSGLEDMKDFELNEPVKSDEVYKAWSTYLRTKTRDTTRYKLLFRENTSYGFRRNLWGLKVPALFILIIAFSIILSFEVSILRDDYALSQAAITALSLLITMFIFWVFVVKKTWVKRLAFIYAERLCESCDDLCSE